MPRAAAVRDVMSAPVAVVREHDSAWHALVRLTETGLRHLVVLDDTDGLVGVLDDRLVLSRWPLDGLGTRRQTVGELVRPIRSGPGGPLRVRADDPVVAAAALMLRCHVDGLPVVDDAGAVIGIVTGSDLVRAMVQAAVQQGERPVTG
jgi:acetoin utilization protein AcuB